MDVHDTRRPGPGSPQLFHQHWLERLSRTNPIVLPLIFVPPAVYLTALSLRSGISAYATAALFMAGLLAWTLFEYLLHRYAFHLKPRTRVGMLYAYLVHGVHHAFPDDAERWVMPPAVSVPTALIIYVGIRASLGPFHAALGAGLLIGYLCYDLTHYAIHRGSFQSRLGRALRRHHLDHHYRSPDRRFGVTTPLWDYVFRTAK